MNRTARVILSKTPDRRQRLVYGVMESATTVFIEGSTVAVTVPQLSSTGPLAADDHVALQKFGTDTLIIGKVGAPVVSTQSGGAALDLDSDGRAAVTFGLAFASTPTVLTGVTFSTFATMTSHVVTKSATGFTVQVDADGVRVASASRQVNWVAIGTPA